MRDELSSYLDELERQAARLEKLDQRMSWPLICLALAILIATAIVLFLKGDTEAIPLALALGLLFALPVAMLAPGYSGGDPLGRRRPGIMRHMRRRVFADGLLADYLREAGATEGLSSANRHLLQSFIEDFLDSQVGQEGFVYSYGFGRLRSRRLARALLLRVLAAELREGVSLFAVDSDQAERLPAGRSQSAANLVPPAQRIAREKLGWTPPSIAELEALERELLAREPRREDNLAALGLIAGAVATLVAYYALPGYAALVLGFGIVLTALLTLLGWQYRWTSDYSAVRQSLINSVHVDIFEAGLLRDFIRARRDLRENSGAAAQSSMAELQSAAGSPLELLRYFVAYFIRMRTVEPEREGRRYNYSMGSFSDMDYLQLVVLYTTAAGLRDMLEHEPESFESW